MDTKQILEYISVKNNYRRKRILSVLQHFGIHYRLETTNPNEYTNIIVNNDDFVNSNMKILVSAHYDAVPRSSGANDNGASVAVLLKLAEYAKTHKSYCPIEFAFFDREESGFLGSAGYVQMHANERMRQPVFFINCDVIGCGDGIVMVKHNNDKTYPTASKAITKGLINKYKITEYKYFPPSDAMYLSRMGKMNGIELSVFPQKDIDNHTSTEVFKYMHNHVFDDIQYINYDMVENVYQCLIDLLFVP